MIMNTGIFLWIIWILFLFEKNEKGSYILTMLKCYMQYCIS